MVQSAAAFMPGLRKVNTDMEASNSNSTTVFWPVGENEKIISNLVIYYRVSRCLFKHAPMCSQVGFARSFNCLKSNHIIIIIKVENEANLMNRRQVLCNVIYVELSTH